VERELAIQPGLQGRSYFIVWLKRDEVEHRLDPRVLTVHSRSCCATHLLELSAVERTARVTSDTESQGSGSAHGGRATLKFP
jgi:hypothetical protein